MTYTSALTALADPTRRKLLERVRRRPCAVGELARTLKVSQPAVSQHLRVLERARLVRGKADGRRRLYSLDHGGLGAVRTYVDHFWTAEKIKKVQAEAAVRADSNPSGVPSE